MKKEAEAGLLKRTTTRKMRCANDSKADKQVIKACIFARGTAAERKSNDCLCEIQGQVL
jgi:hypothetical protein